MCLQLIMNRLGLRMLMVASGAAVAIGVVILIAAPTQSATIGWYAYAPLAEATFSPGASGLLSTPMSIGIVVLVAGLVGLAFSTGFIVGRRRRSPP